MIMDGSPCWSGKEQARREHLILAWIKGGRHPDSSIPYENIETFVILTLLCAFNFDQLHSSIYFTRIAMLV
jgi:hypothetical protein